MRRVVDVLFEMMVGEMFEHVEILISPVYAPLEV